MVSDQCKWGTGIGCFSLCTLVFLLFTISTLIVPGAIRHWFIDALADCQTQDKADSGEDCWDNWRTNTEEDDIPWLADFYVFNVTNPEQVVSAGATPQLVQLGPYRYRKYRERMDFRWYDDKIEFFDYQYLVFDKDGSCSGCSDEDTLITLNPLLHGFLQMADNVTEATFSGLLLWFAGVTNPVTGAPGMNPPALTMEQIYLETQTIRDSIFGYTDPMVQTMFDMSAALEPTLGFSLAALLGSFGLESGFVENYVNGSSVDYYKSKYSKETYYTGKDNHQEVCRMYKQNGQEMSVEYHWDPDYTFDKMRQVENLGVDTPEIQDGEDITIYVSEVRRPVDFYFAEDVEYEGVKLKRYRIKDYELLNSTDHEDNEQWNQFGLKGIANLTAYFEGQPFFLSYNRFLMSDYTYLNGIYGLAAADADDEPYLDVEPISGWPFRGMKKMQANILATYSPYFPATLGVVDPFFPDVGHMLYPLYMLADSQEVDKDDASDYSQIYDLKDFLDLYALLFAPGLILMLCFCGCCVGSILKCRDAGSPSYAWKDDDAGNVQFGTTDDGF